MADGAYAATANGSSGSLLSPDFLKASGAWEQQISLVCFRSVNLEFGFTASIYKHDTWHTVQNRKWYNVWCRAVLEGRRLISGSVSKHYSEVLSRKNIQQSVNSLDCGLSVLSAV